MFRSSALCAHHHQSRPDPLRPPLRAVSRPRAVFDAGFRYRLLPGPSRRGDPLRPGAFRPRSSTQSSRSARCRRAACCVMSAACCKCLMARSTSSAELVPQNAAAPVSLNSDRGRKTRLQAERDSDAVVEQDVRHRAEAEGLNRRAWTHAAGIMISDPRLLMRALLHDPKSDMPVTQFDMNGWTARLVKFDPLSISKTLTVLQTAVHVVERHSIDIDLSAIPGRQAYLQCSGPRQGRRNLQLESAGMRRTARYTAGPVPRTSLRSTLRCIARARWPISRPIARASTTWRNRTTSMPSWSRSCARPSASSSIRSR